MIEEMILKIAILVFFLLSVGIGLTIYEFREHIMEQNKKRRNR